MKKKIWDASWAWWCNSVVKGSQEAEAGGMRAPGQPGIQMELKVSLSNFVRSSLKKQEEDWRHVSVVEHLPRVPQGGAGSV